MADILARLHDLHKQATEERSHNYTAKCVRDAINEITLLRRECEVLRQMLDAAFQPARTK